MPERWRRATPALLLVILGIVFLLWMPAEFLAGDPYVWREEARAILQRGELNLPTEFAEHFGEPGQYVVRNERNGLYYSKYGIVNALLALPPVWLGQVIDGADAAPSLLIFNLWNLAYALALAALLYALSARYGRRPTVRVFFVAAAFFCTSLWFYQRAQSSEIYQVILFTALYAALVPFLRALGPRGPRGLQARDWGWFAAAWLCAALLVFVRLSYGLLLPVVVLLILWQATHGEGWRGLRAAGPAFGAALILVPVAIVAGLAIVNQVKFGAPWLTGYHQWKPRMHWPVGRLADGLWGYFFSPRFSVFASFPLLLFALAGARQFFSTHRLDAVVMLALFLPFLLLLAATPVWAGEWGYGPRYLLPMLPVLALPCLAFADDILDHASSWSARAWVLAALVVLGYSGYLQVQMNRAPFFVYYYAREALQAGLSLDSVDFFLEQNDARTVGELMRHRRNLEALPYFAELKRVAPPDFVQPYAANLAGMLERGNLYWTLPPGQRR